MAPRRRKPCGAAQRDAGAEHQGPAGRGRRQETLDQLPGAEPVHHRPAVLWPDQVRGQMLPLQRRVRHLQGVHQPHLTSSGELKQVLDMFY